MDQGAMPRLDFVAWVVQNHQALDGGPTEITNGSVTNLPANKIRKLLLRSRRAELGDPV